LFFAEKGRIILKGNELGAYLIAVVREKNNLK